MRKFRIQGSAMVLIPIDVIEKFNTLTDAEENASGLVEEEVGWIVNGQVHSIEIEDVTETE